MGRKIIKKVEKLDIQKKQDEVSNSVNSMKQENKRLKEENKKLLKDLYKGTSLLNELQISIDEKIETNKKQKYTSHKTKTKLSDLIEKIKLKEKQIEETDIKLNEINNTYKKQKDNIPKEVKKEESKLRRHLKQIENKIESSKEDLNKYDLEILVYKGNIEVYKEKLEDIKSIKNIKEEEIETLNNLNDNIQSDIVINIDKIDELKKELNELNKNKNTIIDELNKNKLELKEVKKELVKEKNQLEKVRESNIVLIKKEDTLKNRENYIKGIYEKAGVPLNI